MQASHEWPEWPGDTAACDGQLGAGGDAVVNEGRVSNNALHDDLGRDAGGAGVMKPSARETKIWPDGAFRSVAVSRLCFAKAGYAGIVLMMGCLVALLLEVRLALNCSTSNARGRPRAARRCSSRISADGPTGRLPWQRTRTFFS